METMITQTKVLDVFATGTPKGQPRPRAFSRGGRAAVFDPGTAEGWKAQVAIACAVLEGKLLDGPLMVDLRFVMPRPKSHFGVRGLRPSRSQRVFAKKPDADNLAKAVLDAMSVIQVWKDDDQVSDLLVRKRWAGEGSPAGCRIRVWTLEE